MKIVNLYSDYGDKKLTEVIDTIIRTLNNIDSENIPVEKITTDLISDNAVTLAKMDTEATAGMNGHITIFPMNYSAITQGTWTATNGSYMYALLFWNDSNAQNDQVDYKISTSAGTYTFRMVGKTHTIYAVSTILIDNVSVGTLDWYAAETVNIVKNITGITMTAGLHTLSIKAATRNASSGGWYLGLHSLALWRTA